MGFLIVWYLALCLVTMPLDAKLSRWHRRFAPPVVTLLWMIGAVVFSTAYPPSESDIAEARAAATAFRALPHEWQWIIGFAIAMPVLWQVAGAGAEWKAMKQRRRNTQGEQQEV